MLILERGRRWSPDTFLERRGMPGCGTRRIRKSGTGGWISACSAGLGRAGGWCGRRLPDLRQRADRSVRADCLTAAGRLRSTGPIWRRSMNASSECCKPRCVPENQVPERLNVLRKAACASGFETRFRPLPVAITFDDEWRYARERPFDVTHSRKWINEHGKEQGTCVHCGNCYMGCPVSARNTLDLNYLARAETHAPKCARCTSFDRLRQRGTPTGLSSIASRTASSFAGSWSWRHG